MLSVFTVAALVAATSPQLDVPGGRISGSVSCAGEPVAWAMVTLVPVGSGGQSARAITADDGTLLIGGVEAGTYRVLVSHIGFDVPAAIEITVRSGKTARFQVTLTPRVHVQAPIVVSAPRAGPSPVLEKHLDRDHMARSGGILGDPLRAVAWSGGAETRNDFDGRVSIRGAAPVETGVTLDGFPLPSAYHLGGLTSILHPAALEGIRYYTGSHPASLGHGSSGLIAARSRMPGTSLRRAELSAIAAGGLWQGDLSGRVSVNAAARATYHDAAVRLFGGDAQTTIPNFHDINLSATVRSGTHHRLRAHWLLSGDAARMGAAAGAGNRVGIYSRLHRGALFWDLQRARAWGEFGMGLAVAYQPYEYDLRISGDDNDAMDWRSRAFMSRASWWAQRGPVRVELGAEDIHRRIDYRVDLARGFWQSWSGPSSEAAVSSDPVTLRAAGTVNAGTRAAFAQTAIQLGAHWQVEAGLRMDHFAASSERFLDPRATLSWRAGAVRAHVARGIYRGHPLERVGDPTAVTGQARARRSVHTTGGVSVKLGGWGALALEAFNRDTRFVLVENAPGVFESRGSDRARGVEAQWERLWAAMHVSAAYGFADVEQFHPDGVFLPAAAMLPDGRVVATLEQTGPRWVASPWNPGHSLRFRADFHLSERTRFGVKWRFRSGSPVTPIVGTVTSTDGTTVGVAGEPGSARLPAYHRLDVRLERTVPTRRGRWSAFFEVVNTYNRSNVLQRVHADSYRTKTDYRMLPILPTVGFSAEF